MRLAALAVLSFGILSASACSAQPQQRPFKAEDAANFKKIGGGLLTPDGRWLAYIVLPDFEVDFRKSYDPEFRNVVLNRDVTVVLRSTRDDTERQYPAGTPSAPSLTMSGDGRWLAFAAADASGKAPLLQLVDIASDKRAELPGIAEHRWFGAKEDVLLLKHVPAGKAYTLSLQRLPQSQLASFAGVTQHDVNADGTRMVFQDAQGVSLYRAGESAAQSLDKRTGCTYQGWQWSPEGTALAAQRQCEGEAGWSLAVFTALDTVHPRTTVMAASDLKEFPAGYDVVAGPGSVLQWRQDESGLFFQLQPRPEPKKDYPVVEGVVLWHSADPIEPTMKPFLEKSSTPYLAYLDLGDKQVVRLADESLPDVQPHPASRYLLGYDKQAYGRFNPGDGQNGSQIRDYWLVDIKSGKRQALATALHANVRHRNPQIMLSPRGDKVLYQDNARDYLAYDIASGKTVNLTKGLPTHFYHPEDRSPDGKGWWAIKQHYIGVQGWTGDGRHALVSDGYDVWALPLDGTKAQNLTGNGRERLISYEIGLRGNDFTFVTPLQDVDLDQPLYFRTSDFGSGKTGLALRTPGQPGVKLLNEVFSSAIYLKARDADTWVYQRESWNEFPDWYLLGKDFQPVKRLSDAQPQQRELALVGEAKRLTFKTSHGDLRGATLLLPANYQPGKRYPTIVSVYLLWGGWATYHPLMHGELREGYALLAPDITPRLDEPGPAALETVLGAVDAAVATGVVDRDRLGLMGHSYGGFETYYILSQTDLFKAAVPNAGMTNLWSDIGKLYGNNYLYSGMAAGQPFITGGPEWGHWEAFIKNSPLYHARNIKTPLLIIHGDNDDAVPFSQGLEMFSALWRMGNHDTMLVQYEGKNHQPETWGAAAYDDMLMRQNQFFAHFLKGEPAPDWWSGRTSYASGRTPAVTPQEAPRSAGQGAKPN